MSHRDIYKNGKYVGRTYEKRGSDGSRTYTHYKGASDFFGNYTYGKGTTTYVGPRRK